ncbi:MAG: pyridoxal 5'-phosphate synthase glutaminase subunit PdxT [bacterium]
MQDNQIKIGVLCLQGAFIEHINILNNLDENITTFEIRQEKDLLNNMDLDGLILPGGESTTMGKLLVELNLLENVKGLINKGLPVFGTCAGLILLSKRLLNDTTSHIATLDVVTCRNAYGRQLGSFNTKEKFNGIDIPMTFIRAPYVQEILEDKDVKILSVVDDKIVAVQQGNQLGTAFHPELIEDCTLVHEYFIEIIRSYKKIKKIK